MKIHSIFFYEICNIYYIVITYDWNKFASHVKSLIIIISQMGVFGGDDHMYAVNKHFDKLSFSNGWWQDMWGGSFFKLSFQTFFG
jgi:hypothetical protein